MVRRTSPPPPCRRRRAGLPRLQSLTVSGPVRVAFGITYPRRWSSRRPPRPRPPHPCACTRTCGRRVCACALSGLQLRQTACTALPLARFARPASKPPDYCNTREAPEVPAAHGTDTPRPLPYASPRSACRPLRMRGSWRIVTTPSDGGGLLLPQRRGGLGRASSGPCRPCVALVPSALIRLSSPLRPASPCCCLCCVRTHRSYRCERACHPKATVYVVVLSLSAHTRHATWRRRRGGAQLATPPMGERDPRPNRCRAVCFCPPLRKERLRTDQ